MDYMLEMFFLLILVCIFVNLIITNMYTNIMYTHTIVKHVFNKFDYVIYELHNILDASECKILIESSKNKLVRSSVISDTPISDIRTSSNTFLKKTQQKTALNAVLDKIDIITMKISGKPLENQEPLQIVKYTPNQQYKRHYDCCVPHDSKLCIEDAKRHGFRHSTFLLYLNDVDSGGETEFPILNYKFKPKLGNGIFFFNLIKDESKYNENSQHAGLPPLTGDKWVCNKWIRTKRYT